MPSAPSLDKLQTLPETLKGNWNYPTQMIFGPGRIRNLAQACKALGMKRPLLVTDPGLAGLPMVKDAIAANAAEGLPTGLFSAVKPNPVGRNVDDGVAAYKAGGHDGIIAFGGGSGLDCAKAVALMVGQKRPLFDFEDKGDNWKRVDPAGVAPIVAVPTTAGTGSEVGRASVILDEATHIKKIIFHPKMLPAVVICDPELTVGMPPAITAGTGMDALAHCIEAYSSPHYHPMSQGIALEGMRLVKTFLPRAFAIGNDLEARAEMMSAAAMGAVAFQKGLGAVHAISHPIGAVHHTHHGTTNAVVLPHVLVFNRPAIEARIERAAAYLGLAGGFDGFVAFVVELNETLGIPRTLRGLGVADPDIDRLVEMALRDPTAGGNPIPLTPEATRALIEACL